MRLAGGAGTGGTCRGTPNWAAATPPPPPTCPLGLGSATWDVALGHRAVVRKMLQGIRICPLCVQSLLFACWTSPVTATHPYRTRTFSAVSPLPLQIDVPCAGGPIGHHRAQLSLPGDAVPWPAASQAGALWAADQREAIGWDGKGNGHVVGMGTWPGLEQGHPQDRGHSWEAVAHLQAWWLSSPVPAVAHIRRHPTHSSPGLAGGQPTQSLSHLVPARPWGPAQGRRWQLGVALGTLECQSWGSAAPCPRGGSSQGPPSPVAPGCISRAAKLPLGHPQQLSRPFPHHSAVLGKWPGPGKPRKQVLVPGGDPGTCQPRTPGPGHRQRGGSGSTTSPFSSPPWGGHRFLPPAKPRSSSGFCANRAAQPRSPGAAPAPRSAPGPAVRPAPSIPALPSVCPSPSAGPAQPCGLFVLPSPSGRCPPRPGPRIPHQTPPGPTSLPAGPTRRG